MSTRRVTDEMITAHALGELESDADRAAVEAHLATDAAARRQSDEVRATARLLSDELANAPADGLLAVHRAAIERQLADPSPVTPPRVGELTGRRRRWVALGLSVAAAIVIVFGTIAYLFPPLYQPRGNVALYSTPTTLPLNQLYVDGHVSSQNSPFTGMLRSGGSTTGFRDNIYTGKGVNGAPQAIPKDQLDSILLPTDDSRGLDGAAPADPAQPNTEAYDRIVDNGFLRVAENPLSTFSIDVDTASYSNVRRFLNQNMLPPKDAVRIEEMVNYFRYDYAPPKADDPNHAPFAAHIEVAGCPWAPDHRLVRIGLKGREIAKDQRPPSNLVFLVDVSGSMADDNKLPLVKRGLQMLANELTENDRVAIVVYAGSSGLVLPSTPGDQKGTILGAIDALGAGGSTNGAGGITRAYETAVANFIKGGVNRVLLCTDGDFNVGVTDQGALTRLIEEKAATGVYLSVLGFGMGNLKDSTMEKLADKGNGNYAYVDTPAEARKVLVEQMSGTLVTIAKDVKAQVEFNPAKAESYRLIGYENRILAKEDFNDDKKDAGEIGAGHTVTALYELVPAGGNWQENPFHGPPPVDALKYQKSATVQTGSAELLTVKLRYKEPDGTASKLLEFPVTDEGAAYARASGDFKFAASVAAFGMILRDSPHKGTATLAAVIELAQEGVGRDEGGYRAEFIGLVERAKSIREAQGRATPGRAPSRPLSSVPGAES
jgi:Ca-activated chloride channel family protein